MICDIGNTGEIEIHITKLFDGAEASRDSPFSYYHAKTVEGTYLHRSTEHSSWHSAARGE